MTGFSWLHGPCICVPGQPCRRLTCEACKAKQMAQPCPALDLPATTPVPR